MFFITTFLSSFVPKCEPVLYSLELVFVSRAKSDEFKSPFSSNPYVTYKLNPANKLWEASKRAQNVSDLFLDKMLRHVSERSAFIITFISLCEHTDAGTLRQKQKPEL